MTATSTLPVWLLPVLAIGAITVSTAVEPGAASALREERAESPDPHAPFGDAFGELARDDFFTTSEQCAVCHTPAPGATAMTGRLGGDISPYGTWQGTMMANSFRDPYFRAQIMKETAAAGEQIQELCLRCHTPMEHHDRVRRGKPAPRLKDVVGSIFADDSVSCTVCHMISPAGLGEPSTWSGQPEFNHRRAIFGPFEEPAVRPMQNLVNYTPEHAPHVSSSALCATCHTLFTEHTGTAFPEQTPYLEWRNSVFNNEGDGDNAEGRTCQQCHMPDLGSARIARSPMGADFNIAVRDGYRGHGFVGGNAFMLDILAENAEELDVTADPDKLALMAAATRKQLAERTAKLSISEIRREDGRARFAITVENLTGHKFPTGYPARRAWLHVQVVNGRRLLFETGAVDEDSGRLEEIVDELNIPHVQTVRTEDDVVVYEMVAGDEHDVPTTYLSKMKRKLKDNRLLPRGWRADGPHVGETQPVGIDGDADFVGGSDTVQFDLPLPEGRRSRLRVIAQLYYQPVPPVWVDALREVEAEEAKRFVRYYDGMFKEPDKVAAAVRVEAR